MSYVFRSIDMRSGNEIEARVSVDIHDKYWPAELNDYDLQFCSLNGHFFNPATPPRRKDGDVVTGWYLPEGGGGDGVANTFLTLFAYDRTADRFIWPEAFVTRAEKTWCCPYIASTGEGPVSVAVSELLEEFTTTRKVKIHAGRTSLSVKEINTTRFAEIEVVLPVPATMTEPSLNNVTGTCVAVVVYDEHVKREPWDERQKLEPVFKAHYPTIPWWEWQMKKRASRKYRVLSSVGPQR